MVAIKGFHDVVRALPALLARQPDVTALFAGPARGAAAIAYARSLHDLARELGVEHHVIVRPEIPADEIPSLLAAADLVVIPSLYDGLNKTGLEGAAVGTPAVVCRTAGIASYITEHHAGVVVPPAAPDALAAAMIELLGDGERWLRASRGARAMAENFSLDHTADRVRQMYERAVSTDYHG
jgi:D-inositol-3-phosphate glycosyltransferase